MRKNAKHKKFPFQKKRRLRICFLTLLCICLGLIAKPAMAKAEDQIYTENGYVYERIEAAGGETYACISAYVGSEVNLVVPDSLGGCPVREVALCSRNSFDFARYERIRSVVFPDTMVNLNAAACIYFSGLTSVTVPEGTEFIGAGAFYGCSNLNNITIPPSVTSLYGEICDNENLNYHVQNGSYADQYFTEAGKKVVREGEKIPVTDVLIEGKKESCKKLEFKEPSGSRIACLTAEISPAGASDRRIRWEAENPEVIEFADGTGLNNGGSKIYFTVKKGGKSFIRAVSEDGGRVAVCEIEAVVDISCQKIALSQASFEYDGTKVAKVKKPAGFQLKNVKKQKAKLSWKQVKGADGYEIYRSVKQKGKYKKIKTVKKSSSHTFTNGKLKKKSRYFYRVRAYKTVKGVNYYSPFTKTKSVKIKK